MKLGLLPRSGPWRLQAARGREGQEGRTGADALFAVGGLQNLQSLWGEYMPILSLADQPEISFPDSGCL